MPQAKNCFPAEISTGPGRNDSTGFLYIEDAASLARLWYLKVNALRELGIVASRFGNNAGPTHPAEPLLPLEGEDRLAPVVAFVDVSLIEVRKILELDDTLQRSAHR